MSSKVPHHSTLGRAQNPSSVVPIRSKSNEEGDLVHEGTQPNNAPAPSPMRDASQTVADVHHTPQTPDILNSSPGLEEPSNPFESGDLPPDIAARNARLAGSRDAADAMTRQSQAVRAKLEEPGARARRMASEPMLTSSAWGQGSSVPSDASHLRGQAAAKVPASGIFATDYAAASEQQQEPDSAPRTEASRRIANEHTPQDARRDGAAEEGGGAGRIQVAEEARKDGAYVGRLAAMSEMRTVLKQLINSDRHESAASSDGQLRDPVAAFQAIMEGRTDGDATSETRRKQPHGHGRHPGLGGAQNHHDAGTGAGGGGGRAGGPGAPAAIRQASVRGAASRPTAASSSRPAQTWTSRLPLAPSSAALAGSAIDDSSDADLARMPSRDVAPLPSLREGEQLDTGESQRQRSFAASGDHVPSFNGPSRFPGGLESAGQPSVRLRKAATDQAGSADDASTLAEGLATPRRSALSRWRWRFKEFFAELVASIVLLTVGTSVNCQVKLSQGLSQPAGSYPSQNWAWGFAVMSTIHLAGGISGAHCNPGITISLALFRGFPWRLVPIYILAQLLGSFIGSGLGYVIYQPEIAAYQGGGDRTIEGPHETGSLFATVPDSYATDWSAFVDEVVASAILAMLVLAIGDDSNSPPGDGMSGLILGFAVTMVGMAMGWQSGYAVNAARDLGARIMLSCAGYENRVWTHNDYWWIYGPIVGTLCGAIIGCVIYDLAIYAGDASPLNREWTRAHSMVAAARIGARLPRFTRKGRGELSNAEAGEAPPSQLAAPPPLPSFISAADTAKEEVRRRWADSEELEHRQRHLGVIPESRRPSDERLAGKDGDT